MTLRSRDREIEQGLREPGGALVGGLDVLEYAKGWEDYEASLPPPAVTSRDYDLGRARAAEKAEQTADVLAAIRRDQDAAHDRVRAALKDRPDALAEYDARIEAIRSA